MINYCMRILEIFRLRLLFSDYGLFLFHAYVYISMRMLFFACARVRFIFELWQLFTAAKTLQNEISGLKMVNLFSLFIQSKNSSSKINFNPKFLYRI